MNSIIGLPVVIKEHSERHPATVPYAGRTGVVTGSYPDGTVSVSLSGVCKSITEYFYLEEISFMEDRQ